MKRSFGKLLPAAVAALVLASFAMAPYADARGGGGGGGGRGGLTIALPPLAEAACAVFVQRRIVGLDLEHKLVRTDRNELIEFDLISIATGPAIEFDTIPGSRDFALPIRRLDNFVEVWARIHAHALTTEMPLRLTVIGAGAGGVEIALAMKYRLAVCRDRVRVQLVTGAGSILPGHGLRARALLKDAVLRQGVRLVEGVVRHLERDSAQLEDGGVLPSDATMLVTGATAEAWPGESGLATDDRGFIVVTPHLQSASHPFVFAAGDPATFADAPRAKSGVYAVRAGPPLAAKLIATLDGRPLASFKPQPGIVDKAAKVQGGIDPLELLRVRENGSQDRLHGLFRCMTGGGIGMDSKPQHAGLVVGFHAERTGPFLHGEDQPLLVGRANGREDKEQRKEAAEEKAPRRCCLIAGGHDESPPSDAASRQ